MNNRLRSSESAAGRIGIAPLAVLALVVAACAAPDGRGPDDWPRPPDSPGPVELVGHFTSETHAGDRGVSTHAEREAPTPGFCVAYLDDEAREGDDCVVDASPFEWAGDTHPWTVRATWSGLGTWDDDTIARLDLHAFDQDGQPLAHWAGRMHPDAGHVTE